MAGLARAFPIRPILGAALLGVVLALAPAQTARAQSHAPIPVWQGAEVHKDEAIALHNQGYAYARLGYYLPAIEAYNQAIAIAPGWASAYANRAMAYRAMGESEKALDDVMTSIELDRDMVRQWQEWMARFDLYTGEVDGLNGPLTEQALAAWAAAPPASAGTAPTPAQ